MIFVVYSIMKVAFPRENRHKKNDKKRVFFDKNFKKRSTFLSIFYDLSFTAVRVSPIFYCFQKMSFLCIVTFLYFFDTFAGDTVKTP